MPYFIRRQVAITGRDGGPGIPPYTTVFDVLPTPYATRDAAAAEAARRSVRTRQEWRVVEAVDVDTAAGVRR